MVAIHDGVSNGLQPGTHSPLSMYITKKVITVSGGMFVEAILFKSAAELNLFAEKIGYTSGFKDTHSMDFVPALLNLECKEADETAMTSRPLGLFLFVADKSPSLSAIVYLVNACIFHLYHMAGRKVVPRRMPDWSDLNGGLSDSEDKFCSLTGALVDEIIVALEEFHNRPKEDAT